MIDANCIKKQWVGEQSLQVTRSIILIYYVVCFTDISLIVATDCQQSGRDLISWVGNKSDVLVEG